MKIFKFVPIFALLLLVGSSCKREKVVVLQPACPDLVPSVVKLDAQFLGFCTQFFEGGNTKDLKVEITVDGFTVDSNNQVVSVNYLESYDFPRPSETTNNDSNLPSSPVNRAFSVNLPRCGSYTIAVLVRGADGTCFKCCNSTFTGSKSCPGTGTGKGTARFRVVSLQINSSLSTPPPAQVDLKPIPEKCTGCGC